MSFILDTASAHPIAAGAVTAAVGAATLYNSGVLSDKRTFPPGPKPHPIVGHTFQTPSTKIWMWFEDLGKKYGPIIRLSLAGDELVVLNNPEDAEELVSHTVHRLAVYFLTFLLHSLVGARTTTPPASLWCTLAVTNPKTSVLCSFLMAPPSRRSVPPSTACCSPVVSIYPVTVYL